MTSLSNLADKALGESWKKRLGNYSFIKIFADAICIETFGAGTGESILPPEISDLNLTTSGPQEVGNGPQIGGLLLQCIN